MTTYSITTYRSVNYTRIILQLVDQLKDRRRTSAIFGDIKGLEVTVFKRNESYSRWVDFRTFINPRLRVRILNRRIGGGNNTHADGQKINASSWPRQINDSFQQRLYTMGPCKFKIYHKILNLWDFSSKAVMNEIIAQSALSIPHSRRQNFEHDRVFGVQNFIFFFITHAVDWLQCFVHFSIKCFLISSTYVKHANTCGPIGMQL